MNWKMMFAMLASAVTWGSPVAPIHTSAFVRRPTGTDLRNPSEPIQAARIEAAAAKRVRKALKLERDTEQSALRNHCINARCSNLRPFYVAK